MALLMGYSIVPAALKQSATIIFLHGLGDCGQSWAEILPHVRPAYAKIVCPNAAVKAVTLNQGMKMQAWFDLRPLDQPKDEVGIKNASALIQRTIEEEMKNSGISADRIVLGGFSQGGALALYAGLHLPYVLGGILPISTWLPLDKGIIWSKVTQQKILQCHGEEDTMVSIDRAVKCAKLLKQNLTDYQFKSYPGLDHSICRDQEFDDIRDFLATALPPLQSSKL